MESRKLLWQWSKRELDERIGYLVELDNLLAERTRRFGKPKD